MSSHPGYAGKILRVNLTSGDISTVPTEVYSSRFIGGRGIALKIHWDEVPPETEPFDPKNRLVIMTGPLCGIPGFGGSRWQISGKSPIHGHFCYGNLGGAFGAHLKFAGYDGLVIHGTADVLKYIYIDDEKVELRNAADLKGLSTFSTREVLKEKHGKVFRILAIGPAGENRVSLATMLADFDSSCSSGFGAVMGAKNLKAIIVNGSGKVEVADKEGVRNLRKRVKEMKPPDVPMPAMLPQEGIRKQVCFGCPGCQRISYSSSTGRTGKYTCQAAFVYRIQAMKYYKEMNEAPFHATKLCDEYGLDTRFLQGMLEWLDRCYEENIFTEEKTGLPLSKMGSLEFMEAFLDQLANRKGLGDLLADGIHNAATKIGKGSKQLIQDNITKYGDIYAFDPRLFIVPGLFNAMEPRLSLPHVHEIGVLTLQWYMREIGRFPNYFTSEVIRKIAARYWGSELAVDFSTYEGKALAAVMTQDREYAKESMILCDFLWPMTNRPDTDDHVGDPTLESKIYSAVTGIDTDEQGFYELGERIFNLQRAVLAREGHKGRDFDTIEEFEFTVGLEGDLLNMDCIMPGRDGEAMSRKGMVLDRDAFEKMKDEFYEIRGWDVSTGLQTRSKMQELGLEDIAQGLEEEGLLAI